MLLLTLVLTAGGCSSMAKERLGAIPAPSPSPSPSPSPTAVPVAGVTEIRTVDASRPDRLGFADDGPPPEGSVEAVAAAVTAALDQFLDGAQRGQPDLAVLGANWLRKADPAAAETLQTGLTNPDNWVDAAAYSMDVHTEPAPTTVAVAATVDRQDGTTARIQFVFDVTGERPLLDLVGAAEVV